MIKSANPLSNNVDFYSIIHHLNGGIGHELPYQIALQKSIETIQWNFVPILSADGRCKDLPHAWYSTVINHGVLEQPKAEVLHVLFSSRFYRLITDTFRLFLMFSKYFRRLLSRKNNSVIFFESFNPLQLLALLTSIAGIRNRPLTLLLLLRGSLNWGGREHRIMAYSFSYGIKILLTVFRFINRRVRVVLSTDSELVQKALVNFYKQDVSLFPIPHTDQFDSSHSENPVLASVEGIHIWWPGTPRPEKGAEYVSRLCSTMSEDCKFDLYLQACDYVTRAEHPRVHLLPHTLGTGEYHSMMQLSTIILLPYSPDVYNESTSGIFTEAIFAQKIVLATKGTWMGHELEKFGMGELAVSWVDFNMEEFLENLEWNSVLNKIRTMTLEYRRFHNVESFGKILVNTLQIGTLSIK